MVAVIESQHNEKSNPVNLAKFCSASYAKRFFGNAEEKNNKEADDGLHSQFT